jgi:transcriptional regulator with XRE-family HTH domain
MVLTPLQLRAARILAGWTREALARSSGVGAATIKDFEAGRSNPKLETIRKWKRALESAGVVFLDDGAKSDEGGPGVRIKAKKR